MGTLHIIERVVPGTVYKINLVPLGVKYTVPGILEKDVIAWSLQLVVSQTATGVSV